MNRLLVIGGPTAVGKTALGIKLAKKFKGEIISADSKQVYRYMNIGTGKDIAENSIFNFIAANKLDNHCPIKNYVIGYYLLDGIPVWLLDVCKPDQEFSVAHFVKFAIKVVKNIWERGKLAIVVGGTGFWIKALLDGVDSMGIPPDWQLREELKHLGTEKLREILHELNPQRLEKMNRSDQHNPRRLIRAIEISKEQSLKIKKNYPEKLKIDKLLMISLKTKDPQSLYKKIDKRVVKRIKQGVIKEIEGLLKKGYSWKLPAFSAAGYGVWQDYFKKKKSLAETCRRWQLQEHGLARRQLTFFKKDKRIKWFQVDQPYYRQIEKLVKQWYSGK